MSYQQGLQEGIEQGIEKGHERGLLEGIEAGMMLSVEKVMENLPDFSDAEIAAIFGLSVERITQIRKDWTARKRKAAADYN